MNNDTSATAADLAEVRRAALARRDYVLHLARALEQRADKVYAFFDSHGLRATTPDAGLDSEAAAALRQLVSQDGP